MYCSIFARDANWHLILVSQGLSLPVSEIRLSETLLNMVPVLMYSNAHVGVHVYLPLPDPVPYVVPLRFVSDPRDITCVLHWKHPFFLS